MLKDLRLSQQAVFPVGAAILLGAAAAQLFALFSTSERTSIMSLVIGDLSVRLVFNNPTLTENTDGRPQSRSPATALWKRAGTRLCYPPQPTPHSVIAQGLAFQAAALHTVPCQLWPVCRSYEENRHEVLCRTGCQPANDLNLHR
jgi:hypothetical protein